MSPPVHPFTTPCRGSLEAKLWKPKKASTCGTPEVLCRKKCSRPKRQSSSSVATYVPAGCSLGNRAGLTRMRGTYVVGLRPVDCGGL